ncbi:hypothetical protein [Terriglobus sp. RCC_193]|uniref:hypothetical protein n=1 Tax=Terriglobus sp. RCC_193 TaxID=3239218 RepID=UPI0035243883
MTLADITHVAQQRLESVSGMGQVYDTIRNSNSDKSFRELFTKDAKINAWLITRDGVASQDGQLIRTSTDTHNIVIIGYYGFEDGVSEPIIQGMADAIRPLFNSMSARRFAPGIEWSGPMQMPSIYLVNFANRLCHIVRCVWPVTVINEE